MQRSPKAGIQKYVEAVFRKATLKWVLRSLVGMEVMT